MLSSVVLAAMSATCVKSSLPVCMLSGIYVGIALVGLSYLHWPLYPIGLCTSFHRLEKWIYRKIYMSQIERGLSKRSPFFCGEDGMLVISHYNCIVYQEKFKVDNNYTEMFRRNKISIQELREWREKYYYFLNVIIIDYSSCGQLMVNFLAVSCYWASFGDF